MRDFTNSFVDVSGVFNNLKQQSVIKLAWRSSVRLPSADRAARMAVHTLYPDLAKSRIYDATAMVRRNPALLDRAQRAIKESNDNARTRAAEDAARARKAQLVSEMQNAGVSLFMSDTRKFNPPRPENDITGIVVLPPVTEQTDATRAKTRELKEALAEILSFRPAPKPAAAVTTEKPARRLSGTLSLAAQKPAGKVSELKDALADAVTAQPRRKLSLNNKVHISPDAAQAAIDMPGKKTVTANAFRENSLIERRKAMAAARPRVELPAGKPLTRDSSMADLVAAFTAEHRRITAAPSPLEALAPRREKSFYQQTWADAMARAEQAAPAADRKTDFNAEARFKAELQKAARGELDPRVPDSKRPTRQSLQAFKAEVAAATAALQNRKVRPAVTPGFGAGQRPGM